MTTQEKVRAKVTDYRTKTLDKILDLAVYEKPESQKFDARNIFITALDMTITNSMQSQTLTEEQRFEFVIQRLAVMESFAENLLGKIESTTPEVIN